MQQAGRHHLQAQVSVLLHLEVVREAAMAQVQLLSQAAAAVAVAEEIHQAVQAQLVVQEQAVL
jgi:hypothetical protein